MYNKYKTKYTIIDQKNNNDIKLNGNICIKNIKIKMFFFIVDKLSMQFITFTCKKSPTQKCTKIRLMLFHLKKGTRQHLIDDKM